MKRYDKIDDTGSGYSDMREAPAGEWVKYADVEALAKESYEDGYSSALDDDLYCAI